MNNIKELEEKIERLRNIAIELKVDLNIRDQKIRDLERQLAEAHRRERDLVRGTQTMSKLEILGESDDDDGFDPRQTGTFNSPWAKVRK